MSVPHIKQVLINKISAVRITAAHRTHDKKEIAEAERKFKGLMYEETEFTSIIPNPKVENGFIAEINVPGRGYKLTNQRWGQGDVRDVVSVFARKVANQEQLDKIVKPGLYIVGDTNDFVVILNEEDAFEEVFTHLGYRFDEGKYTGDLDSSEMTFNDEICKGSIGLLVVQGGEDGCSKDDYLKLVWDVETEVRVGDDVRIVATLVDKDGKPVKDKPITMGHVGHSVVVEEEQVTTDAKGEAVFLGEAHAEGKTILQAFDGIERDSNRITLEVLAKILGPAKISFNEEILTDYPEATELLLDVTALQEGQPAKDLTFKAVMSGVDGVIESIDITTDAAGKGKGELTLNTLGEMTINFEGNVEDNPVTFLVKAAFFRPEFATFVEPSISPEVVYVGDEVTFGGLIIDSNGFKPEDGTKVSVVFDNGSALECPTTDGRIEAKHTTTQAGELEILVVLGSQELHLDSIGVEPVLNLTPVGKWNTTINPEQNEDSTLTLDLTISNDKGPMPNYAFKLDRLVGGNSYGKIDLVTDEHGNVKHDLVLTDIDDNALVFVEPVTGDRVDFVVKAVKFHPELATVGEGKVTPEEPVSGEEFKVVYSLGDKNGFVPEDGTQFIVNINGGIPSRLPSKDGELTVTHTPAQEGEVKISIVSGGVKVKQDTIFVNAPALPTVITWEGDYSEQVDEDSAFSIDVKLTAGDKPVANHDFQATLTVDGKVTETFDLTSDGMGVAKHTFPVTKLGEHTVNFIGDVVDSPKSFNVKAVKYHPELAVVGEPVLVPTKPLAGKAFGIEYSISDVNGFEIPDASVIEVKFDGGEAESHQTSKGGLNITHTKAEPGDVKIEILYDGVSKRSDSITVIPEVMKFGVVTPSKETVVTDERFTVDVPVLDSENKPAKNQQVSVSWVKSNGGPGSYVSSTLTTGTAKIPVEDLQEGKQPIKVKLADGQSTQIEVTAVAKEHKLTDVKTDKSSYTLGEAVNYGVTVTDQIDRPWSKLDVNFNFKSEGVNESAVRSTNAEGKIAAKINDLPVGQYEMTVTVGKAKSIYKFEIVKPSETE